MTDINIENKTNTADETAPASSGPRRPREKSSKAAMAKTQESISLNSSDNDAAPVEPKVPDARGSQKRTGRNAGRQERGASASTAPEPMAKVSKTDQLLKLLRRKRGAGIAELQEAAGWQAHSVRGFLSGHVKKKLGLEVIGEAGKDGIRRYRVEAASRSE